MEKPKRKTERLYQIDVGYACFGVVFSSDRVVIDVAPIARWMLGKRTGQIANWMEKKRAKATRCWPHGE